MGCGTAIEALVCTESRQRAIKDVEEFCQWLNDQRANRL
jgi:hypothetical protein